MQLNARQIVPWVALVASIAAIGWAVYFPPEEDADFTFCNGTEVQSVDPAVVTGQPEGRVVSELYEGLINWDPKDLHPTPGVAERWEISEDGKTYTFHLRKNAKWVKLEGGQPKEVAAMTAHDFVYSYRRFLNPVTGSQYSNLLYPVVGGAEFSRGEVKPNAPCEVELPDPPADAPLFARGRLLSGTFVSKAMVPEGVPEKQQTPLYTITIEGQPRRFSPKPAVAGGGDIERCIQVLPPEESVAIKALDDYTLQMVLSEPVPYFLQLMGFYPLSPVYRPCVEQYGYPGWTQVDRIVTNGPFILKERRIRDRIRMIKNPYYWEADVVKLNTIDALAIQSDTTNLNLYCTGETDFIPVVPVSVVPELLAQKRPDFQPATYLGIYYYEVNTLRPPMNDWRVRKAIDLAIDKREIVEKVTRAGQIPADRLVPPGIAAYDIVKSAHGVAAYGGPDVAKAQELLKEAGFPDGKDFPKIEILFNTAENHSNIAELIQGQLKRNLNINIELANREWGTYLSDRRQKNYAIARAGWIGDYVDPNTFLDLFEGKSPQNRSGFDDPKYNELIKQTSLVKLTDEETKEVLESVEQSLAKDPAAKRPELLQTAMQAAIQKKRMELFYDAEQILLDKQVLIPLYYYVSTAMVRPYVKGFYPNIQDVHPLREVSVDVKEKEQLLRKEGLR